MRARLLASSILGFTMWAQSPTSWTPDLSMQVRTIGSVTPSPDGSLVAWAQSHAVVEAETSETESQIWIARSDGSNRIQLTQGRKSSTSPKWSNDGKWLYFLSNRFGKNDLFRIPIAGGEAEQLTKVKGGIRGYELSPDNHSAAYTTVEPDEEFEKAVKEKRDMRVLDARPQNARIWVQPMAKESGGKESAARAITPTDCHVQEFDWSPDGASIAFTSWATPVVNDWRKSRIAEVNVATAAVKDIGLAGTYAGKPSYSRDGRYIAFAQFSASVPNPGAARVATYDRNSHAVRQLAATPNEQASLVGWSRSGGSLIAHDAAGTTGVIYEIPMDGPVKEIYAPGTGTVGQVSMNEAGTVIAFSRESSDQAPEAYAMTMAGNGPVQVSAANTALPAPPLGKTEVVRWKSKDGKEVEGLLTLPVGYQRGKKVPLILNIHGGPADGFRQNYIGRAQLYPLASFAAKGFAILRPNPRGSNGYGKNFRYANLGDWGGHDYEDDQAGVDSLIAQGIVDPDRLVIMGWSYGGYMTSWTLGQTTRFKAAAVGAGVIDLVSFTGTTDIGDFLPDYLGGEYWEKTELYRQRSPITYAANVKTPTLVLHGEADERVPLSQGLEYYTALKRHGVPTQMVVYPRTPHNPTEPKFVLDIMKRHLEWVDRYVR
jgi:dipeptidyl aminopeptidase/acylaminoacyl peptidase